MRYRAFEPQPHRGGTDESYAENDMPYLQRAERTDIGYSQVRGIIIYIGIIDIISIISNMGFPILLIVPILPISSLISDIPAIFSSRANRRIHICRTFADVGFGYRRMIAAATNQKGIG